jgi:predicted oxidoreductase (fatty acid repression mutant protein)
MNGGILMNSTFNKLTAQRRSIYALGDQLTNSPEEIYDLIITAIKNSPTAFNSQTVRAVVLFGKSSDKVWDIVEVALKEVVKDPQAFAKTQQKIASFRAGFGTVLFLTETDTVHELEKQFPAYADNFADWAEQGIGGAQQAVWTALAEQQIGASLQHYNPLIDDAIHQAFNLPDSWQLRAEMPFGSIEAPAGNKDFRDDSEKFKLIK